jgi:hypothetical protein
MSFPAFLWRCALKAIRTVNGVLGAIAVVLTIVGGFTQDWFPWSRGGWEYLSWVVPLAVGFVLLIPAVFRGAYELYRDVSDRLALLESRFNTKQILGTYAIAMSSLAGKFEAWSAESGTPSPIAATADILTKLEKHLTENVGLHYAARMHRFTAKQKTETDLRNSYSNLIEATDELGKLITELPD